MTHLLTEVFENNRNWAKKLTDNDPQFFAQLSKEQRPEYLWIACSDSRVSPNQIVDSLPGGLFVHRNIANLVVHTDLNCLSAVQYAVEVLKVKHIIVCGHYGCGGVKAALGHHGYGLIDNWIRNIKDVHLRYSAEIDNLPDEESRFRMLCEKNVIEQVTNVCRTNTVQNAWKSGKNLAVHGLIFNIADGMLHDLDVCKTTMDQIDPIHRIE